MMRNKKLRTVFCGILIFLLVFALFCLGDYGIRYYHTPIKKDYDYTGTGMLVSLTEPDTFEQVSVEIHGKALHYLWGNQEDAIAGHVWMYGARLFVDGICNKYPGKYVSYLPGSENSILRCTYGRERISADNTGRK